MPSECCGLWLESAASHTSLRIKHFSALSLETTRIYLHADLQVKEKAMERTRPVDAPPGRYRPSDALLDYLERL